MVGKVKGEKKLRNENTNQTLIEKKELLENSEDSNDKLGNEALIKSQEKYRKSRKNQKQSGIQKKFKILSKNCPY